MKKQIDKCSHVMFAGLAHEPAYRLATRLAQHLPIDNSRIFFSDSGSVAVEIAMKIAMQYSNRSKFLCFHGGYHGDTLGAMSVSSSSLHNKFRNAIPRQTFVELGDGKNLNNFLSRGDIAAVIVEPLLQGAIGMKIYGAEILQNIRAICDRHGVLMIADECATGFFRLGDWFACNKAGIRPDIMILGKALTAGMAPMAATAVSADVFARFCTPKIEDALMHGPTFMANPLAASAANASLDLFESTDYSVLVANIENRFRELSIPNGRIMGAMIAFDIAQDQAKDLTEIAAKHGVWMRPIGCTAYLMPPLNINEEDLTAICDVIRSL